MAEETTNLYKLAIISLGASLMINLLVMGFALNQSEGYATRTDYPYNSTMFQLVEQHTPTNITCEKGTACTNELEDVPTQSTGIFDVIQSLINIGVLIVSLFEIIAMTVLLPIYVLDVFRNYVTNGWIIILATLFSMAWTYLNAWVIIKIIFKK